MKHTCSGLKKYKMAKFDKPPHYLDSLLQTPADGDGVNLTVMYMNLDDNTRLGWGMRFSYCPACGKKLN